VSGQFKDSDLCTECGYPMREHGLMAYSRHGHAMLLHPVKDERFIPRPAGDEKREGEG
jgi:hypothetical protein